ncbi:MAG: hypothetical protein ABL921_17160 [Pirellula sp.]
MTTASKRLCLLCLLLIQFAGCRGCRQTPNPDPNAKTPEEKKKLQRIVVDDIKAMPFNTPDPESPAEPNYVKPGHWYMANSKLKANFDDESLDVAITVENREGKPAPLSTGQPHIEFNRSLTLSKGQEKNIKLQFFQPEVSATGDDSESNIPARLITSFSQRSLGTAVSERQYPNKILMGYQYHMVSISRDPSRYTFWRKLDCIIWPSRTRFSNERINPHIIVDLKEDEVANQFPSRLYAMTTISHLILNDASLSIMNKDQQAAVQDWLHFGGTIILNGPEALGGIEASFLKELAPIVNTSNATVSEEQVNALNSTWTIQQALGPKIPLGSVHAIPLLAGQLSPGASWVNYTAQNNDLLSLEGLVAERFVGQGRIVMTAFPMTDIAFLNWPSYSSFIHNVVLRKPPRKVTTGLDADTKFDGEMESTELHPVHTTRLRIWARDLDSTMARVNPNDRSKESSSRSGSSRSKPREETVSLGQVRPTKRSSLVAWNPESLILKNARTALQESSGITVPKLNTIIKLLVGYLIVLVPVNWLVFRLLGRLEWAWIAAPIIATIGAFVVARSVQLDVGFSRSQTTFGFLECHSGYPRGVLSKYTALYTSLSTNYRAVYEREEGIVLPLTSSVTSTRRRPLGTLTKIDYSYSGDSGSGLRSSPVLSNTTGLLQSEEMLEMSGSLSSRFSNNQLEVELTNELGRPLKDMAVIGVSDDGRWMSGWVGDMAHDVDVSCKLEPRSWDTLWRKEWDITPSLAAPNYLRVDESFWTDKDLGEELYLGPMLDQIVKSYPFGKGEFIAIGWTDQPLGNLRIVPEAKQNKERTVVLLHLSAANLLPAKPDLKIFPKISDEELQP